MYGFLFILNLTQLPKVQVKIIKNKNFKDFLIMLFSLERLEKLNSSSYLQPRLHEEARIKNLTKKKL